MDLEILFVLEIYLQTQLKQFNTNMLQYAQCFTHLDNRTIFKFAPQRVLPELFKPIVWNTIMVNQVQASQPLIKSLTHSGSCLCQRFRLFNKLCYLHYFSWIWFGDLNLDNNVIENRNSMLAPIFQQSDTHPNGYGSFWHDSYIGKSTTCHNKLQFSIQIFLLRSLQN